jgi:hypothetical protein
VGQLKNAPIGLHWEVYNVGLVMLSLMEGKVQLTPLPNDNTWCIFPRDKCYSGLLYDLVFGCMCADCRSRSTTRKILDIIDVGIKSREHSTNSSSSPEFMRCGSCIKPCQSKPKRQLRCINSHKCVHALTACQLYLQSHLPSTQMTDSRLSEPPNVLFTLMSSPFALHQSPTTVSVTVAATIHFSNKDSAIVWPP